jgi:hypothetical protein
MNKNDLLSELSSYCGMLVEACRTECPATAAAAYSRVSALVGQALGQRPATSADHPEPDPGSIDKLALCLGLAREVGKAESVDPGPTYYHLGREPGWLHEEPAAQVWVASVRAVATGWCLRAAVDEDGLGAIGKLCRTIQEAHRRLP